MLSLIKYISTILCGFYLYKRLLGEGRTAKDVFLDVICTICLAVVMYYARQYISLLGIMIAVIIFSGIVTLHYHQPVKVAYTTSIIAFGLSYIFYVIAATIIVPLTYFLHLIIANQDYIDVLAFLVAGIIQLLLAQIPFRFARLKNGMSFLRQNQAGSLGTVIGVLLLLGTSVVSATQISLTFKQAYLFTVAAGAVLLMAWWLNELTARYTERHRSREIDQLSRRLRSLQAENEALKQNREELKRMIHRDDAFVAAMGRTVEELQPLVSTEEDAAQAQALMRYIEVTAENRAELISSQPIQTTK